MRFHSRSQEIFVSSRSDSSVDFLTPEIVRFVVGSWREEHVAVRAESEVEASFVPELFVCFTSSLGCVIECATREEAEVKSGAGIFATCQ